MATEKDGAGHPAERPELVVQWGLFEDWCQSWDLDPIPATLDMVGRFLTAFPASRKTQARRVRAIRRHHERSGQPLVLPGLTPTIRTVWADGDISAGADVGEALAQLPRYGAPRRTSQRDASGLRGRRDGFLIVLTGALGLSRERARRVTGTDIHFTPEEIDGEGGGGISRRAVTIGGLPVPRDAAPDRCPACAVTRWLRVVTALHHGHRDWALDLVDVTKKDETRHDCDTPFGAGNEWGGVGPLLLSLDQEGWTRPGVPLSVRSITAILNTRRMLTGRREEPIYYRPVVSTRFDTSTPDEVYQAAGNLDDQVAQALMRTQQLLADMNSAVDGDF